MTRTGAFSPLRCTVAVFLLTVLLLGSCKRNRGPQGPPSQPPAVVVVRPVQKAIIEWDEYTGRLAAADFVEIRARVSGYLQSIEFQDGQTVARGDLLFVIDPRPFEAELERAQANRRQTEAQSLLARRNYLRSQQLREQGVISAEDFDTATNNLREAEANQEAATAAVTSAQLNVSYTRIESPINGRVSRKNVSIGNLITGGVANGTLLTTVVSYDPIDCFFDIDERSFLKYQKLSGERQSAGDLLESREQTQAEMALADEEGFPHEGRLNFIDNRLKTDTNTIELRATFTNPEAKLTPGLFARVRIPATRRYTAIMIPDQAVQTDQAQTFVYVVGPDEKVLRKKIELGPIVDNLRVVRSGVKPGDRVVVSGIQAARPGQAVRAEEKRVGEVVPGAAEPDSDKKQQKKKSGEGTKRGSAGSKGMSKEDAAELERMRRQDERLNKGTK